MAEFRPFYGIRPREDLVHKIAAPPYDVVTSEEARAIVEKNPYSFLKVDRAETQFDNSVNMYSDHVYERARDTLDQMIAEGSFVTDSSPCYYVYELTMNGRSQTGLTGCISIDDYLENRIKKHENTKTEKETDRIRHVDACRAHTGPIFLTYRENERLSFIQVEKKRENPLYSFQSDDGICHKVWKIDEPELVKEIHEIFHKISEIYIADGHHRAASAVKAGLKRRQEENSCTGEEEYNYFLSVLFPDKELLIMEYNRLVYDLNGYTPEEFLKCIETEFEMECLHKRKEETLDAAAHADSFRPQEKGEISMYVNGGWYRLKLKKAEQSENVAETLDVAQLQNTILAPILGIRDPKTDQRIRFIGGIRGISVLEELADKNGGVAFVMYPTSMEELFAVADAGLLMPPKSTWFEPKLRSGLFIHRFEQ